MSLIYRRIVNGQLVRLGQYSDHEYVIYIGCKMYAQIDNIGDAYREYNAINANTVKYLF